MRTIVVPYNLVWVCRSWCGCQTADDGVFPKMATIPSRPERRARGTGISSRSTEFTELCGSGMSVPSACARIYRQHDFCWVNDKERMISKYKRWIWCTLNHTPLGNHSLLAVSNEQVNDVMCTQETYLGHRHETARLFEF